MPLRVLMERKRNIEQVFKKIHRQSRMAIRQHGERDDALLFFIKMESSLLPCAARAPP